MYFKQFYLGCLAHASYMIASKGEAAVVDPQRDVDQYMKEAEHEGLKIKHIIETHLHADFVSGHIELARKTGAKIHIGHRSKAEFDHVPVKDGDALRLGDVTLKFLETPGHTPESISIVVYEKPADSRPLKIFTGDTLFIGDVGRPDLVGSKGHTAAEMAGMLYDSLHKKLLTLPDDVEVYPAHGAGSACGRNISSETSSTIGHQKKWNYAVKPMRKEEFVRLMTSDLPPAPSYFPHDAEINRVGARPLDEIVKLTSLSPEKFRTILKASVSLLDTRASAEFGTAHIPGALNIDLKGQFASWSGTFLDFEKKILLVTSGPAEAEEAAIRLARVGFDNVAGYLEGGVQAWEKAGFPLQKTEQIPVDELHHRIAESRDLKILDVRRPGEFAEKHVPGAFNLPLSDFAKTPTRETIDRWRGGKDVVVICQSGYRSSLASSLLQGWGLPTVINVIGGTQAWVQAGYPTDQG